MAGEKRFGTSLFGFKKSDVNSYIEKILREFDDKLKDKENEIAELKNQCREFRIKYEDIARKTERASEDRAKIADVLIKAQEKAEAIIEEAKNQSVEERKKLSALTEKEREKLVDIKQEIKSLKQDITRVLKKYEEELDKVLDAAEEISVAYDNKDNNLEKSADEEAVDIISKFIEGFANKISSSDDM